LEKLWCGGLEGDDFAGEFAATDGGGAADERAVCDGVRERGEEAGGGHDGGGADGRFRMEMTILELGGFERRGEFVDDAEVAETEVLQGASCGTDVLRVAGADEDDGEAHAGGGGEHRFIVVSGGVAGMLWGCGLRC